MRKVRNSRPKLFLVYRLSGKSGYTPQVGFIVKNLAYSVVSGNALHQGYMQEKIVDLGGHGEEFILKDNVGCPMKD